MGSECVLNLVTQHGIVMLVDICVCNWSCNESKEIADTFADKLDQLYNSVPQVTEKMEEINASIVRIQIGL